MLQDLTDKTTHLLSLCGTKESGHVKFVKVLLKLKGMCELATCAVVMAAQAGLQLEAVFLP